MHSPPSGCSTCPDGRVNTMTDADPPDAAEPALLGYDLDSDGEWRHAKHLFWTSWFSDGNHDEFELHGPWWVTGYDAQERIIYVAGIAAYTEAEAIDVITAASGGADIEVLFCTDEGLASADNPPWSTLGGGPALRFPRHEWMAWKPEDGVTCACEMVDRPHDHTVGRPGDAEPDTEPNKVVVTPDVFGFGRPGDAEHVESSGPEEGNEAMVQVSVKTLRVLMSCTNAAVSHWSDPPEVQDARRAAVAPALAEARAAITIAEPPTDVVGFTS